MYKSFKLDNVAVSDKLVAPAKLVDKPALERVETLQAEKACLDRNQKQQNVYYKEYNIHQYKKKNWDEFNKIDVKL